MAYGTHTYNYSATGNILTKAGVNYIYGETAQTWDRLMPHAVTSTSDGQSYTYDCNGNLLSDGVRTFTWDADLHLGCGQQAGQYYPDRGGDHDLSLGLARDRSLQRRGGPGAEGELGRRTPTRGV